MGSGSQLAQDFLVSAMDTIKRPDGQPGIMEVNFLQRPVVAHK
jgi:hypothetical protein